MHCSAYSRGGATEGQEDVTGNAVAAQVVDNDLPTAAGKPSLPLNDGSPDNAAQLEEPTADHERVQHVLPYEA
jgi:hypothetical protein